MTNRIVETEFSDKLRERLLNWKFKSAMKHRKGQPHTVQRDVEILADLFGNAGWFDGRMGDLVWIAVQSLIGEV